MCGRPLGCKSFEENSDGRVECEHVSGLLTRHHVRWPRWARGGQRRATGHETSGRSGGRHPPLPAPRGPRKLCVRVLSAFVPWHRNRGKRFYRSGCLQDSERYRGATHMAEAARRCRNMLAHAQPAAEKVSELVVPSAIPSC